MKYALWQADDGQRAYWRRAHEVGSATYRDRARTDVDEQAGPAYFAGLGLSRWLFWQRLKWAGRQVVGMKGQCALDFGCGFGLMLPMLRGRFEHTIAIDQVPELAADFMRRWDDGLAANRAVEPAKVQGMLRLADSIASAEIPPQSVDLVLALDVLEHFESLPEIIDQLHGLLKPDGRLLVSGPTENWLYKLGRRIVGFSGAYHHQTIHQVETALARCFVLETSIHLPPVLPLFHLLRLRGR